MIIETTTKKELLSALSLALHSEMPTVINTASGTEIEIVGLAEIREEIANYKGPIEGLKRLEKRLNKPDALLGRFKRTSAKIW